MFRNRQWQRQTRGFSGWSIGGVLLWFGLLAAAGVPWAAAAEKNKVDPRAEVLDLFSGIQQGKIEARLVPRDFSQCNLTLTNKTDKPLSVRFPEAFAGVPVLAQLGGGMAMPGIGGPNPQNSSSKSKAPQTLGITSPFPNGMNQMNPGAGNPGMNGQNNGRNGNWPLFNIAPEAVGHVKLKSLCLEYGKPSPTARVPYQLQPFEAINQKPEVYEICRMLGQEGVSQRVAQAAVWHAANNVRWQDMALSAVKALFGQDAGHFTAAELQQAKRLLERATKAAQDRASKAAEQVAKPQATVIASPGAG